MRPKPSSSIAVVALSCLTLRFNPSSGLYPQAVFFPSNMAPDPLIAIGQSWSWHIMCNTLDRQVLSLAQICSQIRSFHSSVESLVIECEALPGTKIVPTVWLQLFHSFPLVQSLQISSHFEWSIAAALGGLTGKSAANVFPSLQSLVVVAHPVLPYIDTAAPLLEGIQPFVAARQRSGHPVAVSCRK
jgi:hypothetical protein